MKLNAELPSLDDDKNNPFSPNAMGINPERSQPKSLNPLRTYDEQEQELSSSYAPTDEEQNLAKQAQGLEPTDADASSKLAAQLMDIVGTTSERYSAAKGVPGAGKTITSAQEALKAQMDTREQLRKNLLTKIESKKTEREEKRKGMYDRLGLESKLAQEGREVSEFGTKQQERARMEEPLSPQQQEMYKRLAAQRGIKIDLSSAKRRDVGEIEKAIGLGVKPQAAGGATGSKDEKAPIAAVKIINEERRKTGLSPLPEDGTISYRDLESVGFASGEARRSGMVTPEIGQTFDPTRVARGSVQEREYKVLADESRKVKEKISQNTADIAQLTSLLEEAASGNPVAANAGQRQIALLFNKGALSDQDVTAFSGSQNVIDRMRRTIERNLGSGAPLTQEDMRQFKEIIPSLQRGAQASKSSREQDIRRRAQSVHPGLGDFLFGGGAAQPSTTGQKSGTMPDDKVKVQSPDGKIGRIPRRQLDAAKKQGYVEVP
jgi:hypothetical protein